MKRTFGNFAVFIGVMSAFPYANASIVSNDALKIALATKQDKLGYTAENSGNKTKTIAAAASANDTKYPTEKAVRTELDKKQNALTNSNIKGTGSVTVTVTDGVVTVHGTDADTKYTLPKATATTLGGVIIGDNITVDNTGKISAPAPVTPGNGTVTIKQGGVQKGTFTMNQAGATTIELTDNNTTYTAAGTNGVSASVSSGKISVSGTSATRDVVGVAKLGVIPVGTTGTGTAAIWVE